MNPFITLTNIEGYKSRFNVNHIVSYELRSKTHSGVVEKYTYVLLISNCTRSIKETPEEIDELINHAVFNIPFTQTQLKGA